MNWTLLLYAAALAALAISVPIRYALWRRRRERPGPFRFWVHGNAEWHRCETCAAKSLYLRGRNEWA